MNAGGVEARLTGPGGERLPRDGGSAGELEVRGTWITGAYYNGTAAVRVESVRRAERVGGAVDAVTRLTVP